MPRPENRGARMRMMRMVIHDAANLEYQMDTAMSFTLTSEARMAEPSLRIRVMLYSSMAAPVAMAQSEGFEVRAGETFTRRVKMSLDGLAPGKYSIKMSLIGDMHPAKSYYYDTILDVGSFIIVDDPSRNAGFTWQERLWGNYRMKNLEIS